MQLQEAVLQEIRSGVNILQAQDNQIVQEGNSIFEAHKNELEAISKWVTNCDGQMLSIKGTNVRIQRSLQDMNSKIVKVNEILDAIKNSLRGIPSKRELREHAAVMEDQLAQSRELNTGLTMAMEGYKFSESASYNFGKQGPQAGSSTTVRPERRHYIGSDASSLIDTESEITCSERIRGGAASVVAAGGAADEVAGGAAGGVAGGAAGGEAGGAAGGAAGGRGGAGDPPPPGSGPPSDHGNNGNNPRLSKRPRRFRELQYAKLIKIKEPKRFEGNVGDDFNTWWIMQEVYIRDQPEKFPNDERMIDWIGSLMDRYAAAWHIQWLRGTFSGKHPKSITGYIQALKLQFEDMDAKDEAYAAVEKVQSDGCIRDMFTQIKMHNDKALVSEVVLKKIILDRLPHKILEQMDTIDLIGKTDDEIINIITNTGRTPEKWDEAKTILGLKKSISEVRKEVQKQPRFGKNDRFDRPRVFKNRFQGRQGNKTQSDRTFKPRNKSNKTYAVQMEGIEKSELDRRKAAGECQRCTWPADRKGAHKTMDCFGWARKEIATVPFPKAKEYQKLKIGAYGQEDNSESEIDLYTTDEEEEGSDEEEAASDCDEDEEEGEAEDELQEEFSEQGSQQEESVSSEKNW